MTEDTPSDPDEVPYGARLLETFKRRGVSVMGTMKYAEIQELKRADREQTIRILQRDSMFFSFAMLQLIRTGDPDDVAVQLMLTRRTP